MNTKPTIVFTFPNCMGGVSSFNYNIINYSLCINYFYSKVILLKSKDDRRSPFLDVFFVDEVILFEYSEDDNQYYVQKRLNKLIGNEIGALVTDNALTLSAVDPSFFSDAVFASNPIDFTGRSFYIPYGVKEGLPKVRKELYPDKLNLVFLGRLANEKGVNYLIEIEQLLQKNDVAVNWTIIGKGPQKKNLIDQWENKNNIMFFEPDTTDEVYEILGKQDIFIFPTSFEGTPVSILECLANGVVTVVNDLPGGIRDIVTNDTGFRCEFNDIDDFKSKILLLHYNRDLLKQMQLNCFAVFKKSFDIRNNADNYFKLFLQFRSLKRKAKNTEPIPMSRLDIKYFPSFITKLLRKLKWQTCNLLFQSY